MMITRQEGHGSFTKQFWREGSMGSIMKVSHLHGHHAYSSGEILSPRSVLEQRALSGLAIAIDLEEKMKLSPYTQENVILGRFFSKQSIMHMSSPQAKDNLIVGRFFSRERLNHMMYMNHAEREALTGESSVGLKMVISMHQMSNQDGKAEEKLVMGRSLSRERMRPMIRKNGDEERDGVTGGSSGGLTMDASSEGERNPDSVCSTGGLTMDASLKGERKPDKTVRSSEDQRLKRPPSSSWQSKSRKSGQSTSWLHELGCVQQSFPACPSSMEDSIFYYAANNPPPPSSSHHQACFPIEGFLQCCYFCKCCLGDGKDIYMYRGDQAFCSVECRYAQIAKDECVGALAL